MLYDLIKDQRFYLAKTEPRSTTVRLRLNRLNLPTSLSL